VRRKSTKTTSRRRVARWTAPVDRLLEGETEKLIHMEERLHQRVIGQDERSRPSPMRCDAREQDCRIRTGRSARSSSSGRLASGRRNSRVAVAEFMFDDDHAMVRIDMSEYQERQHGLAARRCAARLHRLDEGGQLTEAVRRRPYSVVLLDEIRRPTTDVFDVFAAGARRRPAD